VTHDPTTTTTPSSPAAMEIGGPGLARRLRGWLFYVAVFAAAGGGFVWLFYQFTTSWRIALGVVTFMVAYMVLMSYLAERGGPGGGSLSN